MKNKVRYLWILLVFSVQLSYSQSRFNGFMQEAVSADGQYVSMLIDKSFSRSNPVLVVQSVDRSWKYEIKKGTSGVFSRDSKYFIYQRSDTVYTLKLGSSEQAIIPGVSSWEYFSTDMEWVVAKLKSLSNTLLVKSISNSIERKFENINRYFFNHKGTELVTESSQDKGESKINWINLSNKATVNVWSGTGKIIGYDLDTADLQLAFMVKGNNQNKEGGNAIWYFKKGMDKPEILLTEKSHDLNGLSICDAGFIAPFSTVKPGKVIQFSPNGHRLLFYLKEGAYSVGERPSISLSNLSSDRKGNEKNIDVWSYLDTRTQPLALKASSASRRFATIIDIKTKKLTKVERDKRELLVDMAPSKYSCAQFNDEYAIIFRFASDVYGRNQLVDKQFGPDIKRTIFGEYCWYDFDWNRSWLTSVYLVSLIDGSRKLIRDSVRLYSNSLLPFFQFSPDFKYIVFYDPSKGCFYSYRIETAQTSLISDVGKIDFSLGRESWQPRARSFFGLVERFWIVKEGKPFFHATDNSGDIWQLDISGNSKPLCITNGFARKNSIKLSLLNWDNILYENNKNDEHLFVGTVEDYGYSGYYAKSFFESGDPRTLIKAGGKYNYTSVIKTDAKGYLVSRHNSFEPPSCFFTRDFIQFHNITSSENEERVCKNKELLTWKTFDGTLAQGVLYKPRNFDSTKKYPVVITYYESSKGKYQEPQLYDKTGNAVGDYDGYLYFVPGIKFRAGETGPSVFNCVVSGAKYLAKRAYVDSLRMGIYGASFGGIGTYYMVTHTNIFAAAVAGCGWTNMISQYGSFPSGSNDHHADAVWGQGNMCSTPWQRPDLYIKNSPVLYADRINTPLLMSHNPNDHRVPFQNAVEMFTALRRLGKRGWLLVGETGHYTAGVDPTLNSNYESARYQKQFFDHFLKGAPAPKWILEAVPPREQGMEKWMELDSSGRTAPIGGLQFKDEILTPEQEKLLKHKTRVTDDGRIEDVIDDKDKSKGKKQK